MDVGRVTAVFWPGGAPTAVAYAELADGATQWPGLPGPFTDSLTLIIVPDRERFDSLSQGRLPEWGAGAAFPRTRTILITADRNGRQVLRHELAHLALRSWVRVVPRWFDEGYASRAAGEWNRLDWLQMNLALAAGRPPTLLDVNRGLRGSATGARNAYGFATSAVLLLERLGRGQGLRPLIRNLSANPDFDTALRRTYGLTLAQFEQRWRSDLRRRYGWLSLVTSFSVFWLGVASLVMVVWLRRRKRNRIRREALNEGWEVPVETHPELDARKHRD